MSELVQRALRSLEASPLGAEIARFFGRPEVKKKLRDAALTGRPPAAAISHELLEAVPSLNEDTTAKRRIGLLISGILESEGFEQDRSGVRIADPLFVTGSTYRLRREQVTATPGQTAIPAGPLAAKIGYALDEDEAAALVTVLRERFPNLF